MTAPTTNFVQWRAQFIWVKKDFRIFIITAYGHPLLHPCIQARSILVTRTGQQTRQG